MKCEQKAILNFKNWHIRIFYKVKKIVTEKWPREMSVEVICSC